MVIYKRRRAGNRPDSDERALTTWMGKIADH